MTQVRSVMGYYPRLFRAMAGKRETWLGRTRLELTSQQNLDVRRFARRGDTLETIAKLIGWRGSIATLRTRLKEINVTPGGYSHALRGRR